MKNQNLINIRKNKNLTQRKLANLIGINPSIMSRYENNITYPNKINRKKISEILEVEEDTLFQMKNYKSFKRFYKPDRNNHLVSARLRKNMTLKELSRQTGIPAPTLTAYEKFFIYPSEKNKEIIGQILNKDPEEIFPEKLKNIRRNRKHKTIKSVDDIFRKQEIDLNKLYIKNNPQSEILKYETYKELETALDSLTIKQKDVLKYRFGFYDLRPHTLEEIASKLGISKQRVDILEEEALERLRIKLKRYFKD